MNSSSYLVYSLHTRYFKSVTIFTAAHKAMKTNWIQIQKGGNSFFFFNVLLTVRLSIILVIDQLNAQILVL